MLIRCKVLAGWLQISLLCTPIAASAQEQSNHEFHFARGIYGDDFGVGDESGGSWSIDYPKADRQFLFALQRLSLIDSSPDEFAIKLTDPDLRHLPFIYALEVGAMQLREAEIKALREYLLTGGFLLIDDFWGTWAWENLVAQMQLVFPDRSIVELAPTHPIFSVVYEIAHIEQIPNFRNGIAFETSGITHEGDGTRAQVYGIFDDAGHLMVLINRNTDLGDAWEWADHPQYPAHFSAYAVKLGVNIVIYTMTH